MNSKCYSNFKIKKLKLENDLINFDWINEGLN